MNKTLIKTDKNIHGFSLLEVSIASIILLILLIPIFTILSKGSSGTIHNRNEITARQYASNIIAYCNMIPFNSPELNEGDDILGNLNLNFDKNNYIKLKNNIDLNDLDESFLKLVKLKKLSIKNIEMNDIPCKHKLITFRIEWLEPGKTTNNSVEMSGLVSEL